MEGSLVCRSVRAFIVSSLCRKEEGMGRQQVRLVLRKGSENKKPSPDHQPLVIK
jgi:hypothetical protein